MRFVCGESWKREEMRRWGCASVVVLGLLALPAGAPAFLDEPVARFIPEPVHVFPIAGPHELQRWEDNGFGGARHHMGQDLFARCGEPVVAAEAGRVRRVAFEGAAGNYVVVSGGDTDQVYMHLRHASRLATGERVDTGDRVGEVGQSGDATACHLHFELWTRPGWYRGGHAFDPLPRLRRWDREPSFTTP
jgi:murein DD-endopeptidase MepM/ murein hydrolase activator NlpD